VEELRVRTVESQKPVKATITNRRKNRMKRFSIAPDIRISLGLVPVHYDLLMGVDMLAFFRIRTRRFSICEKNL